MSASEVDRFSQLPESLISRILSLLPTKAAFATSFVSKTWKLHWTKVTAFDFDDSTWTKKGSCFENCSVALRNTTNNMTFEGFVNMVLIKNDGGLTRFRLRWNYPCCSSCICNLEAWTKFAISRTVSVLDLDIRRKPGSPEHKNSCFLPESLYTCKTLEVLKLQGPFCVQPRSAVCLPKLRVLLLKVVRFGHHEHSNVQRLISGYPMLESLSIRGYAIKGISCPRTLKRLHIYVPDVLFGLMKVMELDVPQVECLTASHSEIPGMISIGGRTSAGEVAVDFLCCSACQVSEEDSRIKPYCSHIRWLYANTMNILGNYARFERYLTKLVLRFHHPHWSCLADLMDRCAELQVLHVSHAGPDGESEVTRWEDPVRVPKCVSSSLQELTFRTFYGT